MKRGIEKVFFSLSFFGGKKVEFHNHEERHNSKTSNYEEAEGFFLFSMLFFFPLNF